MDRRRNKVKGGLEPGLGVTFTPSRVPDDDDWMDTFNQLMVESNNSRTKLIIDLIRKGLKAHLAEQAGELVLTPSEQQLIQFMRQHGLSDHRGTIPESLLEVEAKPKNTGFSEAKSSGYTDGGK